MLQLRRPPARPTSARARAPPRGLMIPFPVPFFSVPNSNIHKPTTFPARRMERPEKKLASLAPPRRDMDRMMKRNYDDKWGNLEACESGRVESHPIPLFFLHHVDRWPRPFTDRQGSLPMIPRPSLKFSWPRCAAVEQRIPDDRQPVL